MAFPTAAAFRYPVSVLLHWAPADRHARSNPPHLSVSQFEKRILYDMDSRVPRMEAMPSTPSADLSYWYGSRRGPGQDYYVYTRRPGLTKLQGGLGTIPYVVVKRLRERLIQVLHAEPDLVAPD
jgi:hypothetical protein